jgi:cation:H+ antiporter
MVVIRPSFFCVVVYIFGTAFFKNDRPLSSLHSLIVFADFNWQILRVAVGLDAAGSTGLNVLLLLAGMAVITKGGDLFTDSAVAIARATRIPPVIVGATIVSMATTFPEFMVSLAGSLSGNPGFAVGNALGSCCCNIGLIVGSCALLKGFLAKRRGEEPGIPVSRVTLLGPGLFMLAAGSSVWLFSSFDAGGASIKPGGPPSEYGIARWQAGLLVALLVGYLAYSLRSALQARFEGELEADEEEAADQEIVANMGRVLVSFLIGAALVVLGSKLMVSNAEQIAIEMGVPKLIIGLTVLAIGTSLPEFTISLLAVIKGHGALGIGNIIGANVLNICWVVATCALISPLPIQSQTVILDAPCVLLLMILLPALAYRHERISTASGAVLLTVYLAYMAILIGFFS